MFICIRRIHLRLGALGLVCLLCAGAYFSRTGREETVFSPQGLPVTVIVDAGHGGEDGGAVAADGTVESGLNLEIALRVNDLLRFTGCRTDMTRREDAALHDTGLDTIRARKASDLRNRAELVNGTENAVFLSIHQNSLPSSPKTQGAQSFWNGQPEAEALATAVQEALNTCVNEGRAKDARPMGRGVYLMEHIQAPGLLIECGFLSNGAETAALQTAEHQRKLACAITGGFLRGMAGEGGA